MGSLDFHALYSAGGSTSLIVPSTIPAADGAAVAGVPQLTSPGIAELIAWGSVGVDATKAIKEVALQSGDLNDPANQSIWLPTGTSLAIMSPHMMERLPYVSAARVVQSAQKAAGAEFTYTIDNYKKGVGSGNIRGAYASSKRGLYSQTFSGALTAGAWGTQAFTPSRNLPSGQYAILGFTISSIANVAAIRFQHSDFGQL